MRQAMKEERGRIVKWRWWDPVGALCHPDGGWALHQLEMNVASYNADDIAEEIVQKHVEENGADGANSFEIEVGEPAFAAGVYDVALEWEPTARATRRQSAAA